VRLTALGSVPVRRTVARARRGAASACTALLAGVLTAAAPAAGQSAPPTPARAGAAAPAAVSVVDALGTPVRLARPARRVVSVVPSATDLLVALGAARLVAGRTDYDTAAAVRAAPSVGGGIDPNVERIVALRPDLVVAWPEASAARVRDALRAAGVPVYAAGLRDTAALYATLGALGTLAGRAPAAAALAAGLRARLAAVRARADARVAARGGARPAVLFLAAERPPFAAGADTYVMQLAGLAGGRPAFPDAAGWPQLSLEAVVARDPDVLLIARRAGEPAGAPLARLRALPGWRGLGAVRAGRVFALDAAAVTRPGPRLAAVAEALDRALAGVPVRE
jgi:ABC-type Fe3+-hydroxamate transport system substrate-binding protein